MYSLLKHITRLQILHSIFRIQHRNVLFLGVLGFGNDVHAADFACLVGEPESDGACAAVGVCDFFFACEAGGFFDFVMELDGLLGVYLEEGPGGQQKEVTAPTNFKALLNVGADTSYINFVFYNMIASLYMSLLSFLHMLQISFFHLNQCIIPSLAPNMIIEYFHFNWPAVPCLLNSIADPADFNDTIAHHASPL